MFLKEYQIKWVKSDDGSYLLRQIANERQSLEAHYRMESTLTHEVGLLEHKVP